MQSRLFFAITILVAATMAVTTMSAQTRLKEYSQQKGTEWRAARAVAESIALANAIPIRVKYPDGRVAELQRFEDGIPRCYSTFNLTSAKTVSSNKLWIGGGYGFALSGSTDTLGEWDAGSGLTTHQEFGGRIIYSEGSIDPHSTHVAGTMIAAGVQSAAHGMSYQAHLECFDWNNDVSEMGSAASVGLRVSNHSYGTLTGWNYNYFGDSKWVWFGDASVSQTQDYRFGFYDAEAQSWDAVAYNSPYYLPCKAAGNDRGEGPSSQPVVHWAFNSVGGRISSSTVRDLDGGTTGYRTLNGSATAKDILVVGAVSGIPSGYVYPWQVLMTDFSCWGPTDDGRVKPDVVADGVNLLSAYSTSNTSYAYMSGTSMATPSVTGSVGLLLQHQKNLHGSTPLLSSTLRGLIIHTADDAGNAGPDYSFGWGLMNTLSAARLMSLDSADGAGSHVSELHLFQGDTINVAVYSDSGKPMKVTICWTDPPGLPVHKSLNPTNAMLVNDLDLRVYKQSDQTVYSPWVLDPSNPSAVATTGDNVVDNVEQVVIPTAVPGAYWARITHKRTLLGGSQYVSVIVSGNVPYYKPVQSVAPLSFSYSANPGVMLQDSFKVHNYGNKSLSFRASANATWLLPDTSVKSVSVYDSAYLHFGVDASGLHQWSSYQDSIIITSNDTTHSPVRLPVSLSTHGPRIQAPTSITVETDSGLNITAHFKIHNVGTMSLAFNVVDIDVSPPTWLTIGGEEDTVAIGDSIALALGLDARVLTPGDYGASLKVMNNDSSTGDLTIPLTLRVFSGSTISSSVNTRWNLVSLPLKPFPFQFLKSDLYHDAISPAYAYSGRYSTKDTVELGVGYWMKFSGSQSIDFHGTRVLSDTIPVTPGWNLIGAISYPVPVATIGTNSPGMITSRFFGYMNRYRETDTLAPGKGYWVKANQDGYIILSSSPFLSARNFIHVVPNGELPPTSPDENTLTTSIPTEFALEPAYPNPFNPTTTITYELPVESWVTLRVYDALGRETATLVNGMKTPGSYSVPWDASGIPSGVYFYRLQAGTFSQAKKLLLLR